MRGPWIRKTGASLRGRGAEQTLVKTECGPGGALRVTLLPRRSTCQTRAGHRPPRGPKQEQKDGAWGGKRHLPLGLELCPPKGHAEAPQYPIWGLIWD